VMYSLDEARDILRVSGTDNDAQIEALVQAIPDYLFETTGYRAENGLYSPVALTAGRFLLWQWYYGESADVGKVQRVIDCLLKALSAERAMNEN
jgi:hypothetical protein